MKTRRLLPIALLLLLSTQANAVAIPPQSVNLNNASCSTKDNRVTILGATVTGIRGLTSLQDISIDVGTTTNGVVDLYFARLNFRFFNL